MTKYPDTVSGVIAMLNDESDLTFTREDCEAVYPDPWVKGVWKIDFKKPMQADVVEVVAFLGGYPDPWGTDRDDNDWECAYLGDLASEAL